MKTKEEFIKNIREFIAENRYGLKVICIAGAFFCFGVPLIMNFAYIFGQSHALFVTTWDAADLLSYYGTLLGATATIIAVTLTINFSRKSAEKDRRLSENNNFRNYGIQICIDYLELCSYKRISDLINDISNYGLKKDMSKHNSYVKSKISEIDMLLLEIQEKFDIFHPNIPVNTKRDIIKFYVYSGDFLNQLEDLLLISEESPIPPMFVSDAGIKITEHHRDRYWEFQKIIQEIIFNYDYSINNRENELKPPTHASD